MYFPVERCRSRKASTGFSVWLHMVLSILRYRVASFIHKFSICHNIDHFSCIFPPQKYKISQQYSWIIIIESRYLAICWTSREHGPNSENVLSPSLVQRRGTHCASAWERQHLSTCLSIHLRHTCFVCHTHRALTLVFSIALHVILDILSTCVRHPCFYLRVCYGAIQIVLLLLLVIGCMILCDCFTYC